MLGEDLEVMIFYAVAGCWLCCVVVQNKENEGLLGTQQEMAGLYQTAQTPHSPDIFDEQSPRENIRGGFLHYSDCHVVLECFPQRTCVGSILIPTLAPRQKHPERTRFSEP